MVNNTEDSPLFDAIDINAVDSRGYSALHVADSSRFCEIAKYLVSVGAEIKMVLIFFKNKYLSELTTKNFSRQKVFFKKVEKSWKNGRIFFMIFRDFFRNFMTKLGKNDFYRVFSPFKIWKLCLRKQEISENSLN